jgi:hypothetical protein
VPRVDLLGVVDLLFADYVVHLDEAVGVVEAVIQRCIVTSVIAECKHAERLGEKSSR